MKNNLFVKIFVVFLFCATFSMGVNAQNMFSKGDKVFGIGIGLGSNLGSGKMLIPPLAASFEVGIIDNLFDDKSSLGVGAYLGYYSEKWWELTWNYTVIGARGAVHYQLVDKLDTYGGIMLGYNNVSVSSKYSGTGGSNSGLVWSLYLGGRYYFKENIGAFAELGYGIAYLTVGINFKF